MPSVMIRRNEDGSMAFYIAKKDQEEIISSMQFDSDAQWGGEVTLEDGSSYYIEPIARPRLPITVRARRAGD